MGQRTCSLDESRIQIKAIMTLARMFLGVIYKTLKNKWVLEDFPNYVLVKTETACVEFEHT